MARSFVNQVVDVWLLPILDNNIDFTKLYITVSKEQFSIKERINDCEFRSFTRAIQMQRLKIVLMRLFLLISSVNKNTNFLIKIVHVNHFDVETFEILRYVVSEQQVYGIEN
jgi:hypothetical protein